MKFNKIFLTAAAFALALTACEDKPEWTPASEETNATVYFPKTEEVFEFEPGTADSYTFEITRVDSTAELTVPLIVLQNDEDVYTVPADITFPANVATVEVTVKFGTMKEGIAYILSLALDTTVVSKYSDVHYTLSTTPIKYEVGKGVLHEKFYTKNGSAFYTDYKLAKLSDGSMKLVLLNPFVAPGKGEEAVQDEDGIYDAFVDFMYRSDEKNHDFLIEISDKGEAYLNPGRMGILGDGVNDGILAMFGDATGGENTLGKLTPDVSVIFEPKTLILILGEDAYYAQFAFYFSKEAYLEHGVEKEVIAPVDATFESYIGTFSLNYVDSIDGKTYATEVEIKGFVGEDGVPFYGVYGLPNFDVASADFDSVAHVLAIYPQTTPLGANGLVTIKDKQYLPLLLTYTADGNFSQEEPLLFACDEKGILTLHPQSKAIAWGTYLVDLEANAIVGTIDNGFYEPVLTPKAPSKVARKAINRNSQTRKPHIYRQKCGLSNFFIN